jgi:hypothetical protein
MRSSSLCRSFTETRDGWVIGVGIGKVRGNEAERDSMLTAASTVIVGSQSRGVRVSSA